MMPNFNLFIYVFLSLYLLTTAPILAESLNRTYPLISISEGESNFDRIGLQGAISSFLGSPSQASGGSSRSFLNSVQINYGTTVKITKPNRSIYMGLRNDQFLNNSIPVFWQAGFKMGSANYFLPRGLTPFIDPIKVETDYQSWDIEIGSWFDLELDKNLKLTSQLGTQKSYAQIYTNVSSKLLKIASHHQYKLSKSFITLSLSLKKYNRIRPMLQYERYTDGFSNLHAKLQIFF